MILNIKELGKKITEGQTSLLKLKRLLSVKQCNSRFNKVTGG